MVEVEGERVRKVKPSSRRNNNPERGASLVEYALLVALLCVVAVGGVRAVGVGVQRTFTECDEEIKVGAAGIVPDDAPPPVDPDTP